MESKSNEHSGGVAPIRVHTEQEREQVVAYVKFPTAAVRLVCVFFCGVSVACSMCAWVGAPSFNVDRPTAPRTYTPTPIQAAARLVESRETWLPAAGGRAELTTVRSLIA